MEREERVEAIAKEAFAVLGTGEQVPPFTARYPGFDLDESYDVVNRVRDRRAARGEARIGRKIGFTNREVQIAYHVHGPIWNYMFDSTVREAAKLAAPFALSGLPEPLLEPEIALHLAVPPLPGMSEDELFGCVDWVAHGCEIVQSIFPGWKVKAADCVAGYGLHGAYFLGPKRTIGADRRAWAEALSSFTLELSHEGEVVRRGRATNVLGGPVKALKFLVDAIAASPQSEPLRAGEIVTTGTLTDAMPIGPRQRWSTKLAGIALPGLELRFA